MNDPLDHDLIRKAMAGDAASFRVVVETYQDLIYRICRRYLPLNEAQDAAQETFLRAFVHQQRFDPDRPLGPWLVTIARRLCIDEQRKRSFRSCDGLAAEPLSNMPDLEQTLVSREEWRRFCAGLETLPVNQREALCLFYLEGMSYSDLAHALEVPMGTIMTWLHRGKSRLLAFLERAESEAPMARSKAMGARS